MPKPKKSLAPHLTYMIAETLIAPSELDVTRFRGYGIGQRDPASPSDDSYSDFASSRKWTALRKWVQSANSAGVKY